MKRLFIILSLVLALSVTGCAVNHGRVEYIGAQSAKNIAAQAAGFDPAKVSFTDTDLESRGSTDYYQVEFRADGIEYEYDIDAISGRVIDSRQSAPTVAEPTVSAPVQQEAPQGGADTIGSEAALGIALENAGFTAEQVTVVKNRLDREDGRQCYEIEFYTADYTEYDYDIDAYSGEILRFDLDAEGRSQGVAEGKSISAEDAKAIALAQVPGATVDDIRGFETDYDDGRLEYEGRIIYDGMEYEFEIDGYSGAIRSWEAEKR